MSRGKDFDNGLNPPPCRSLLAGLDIGKLFAKGRTMLIKFRHITVGRGISAYCGGAWPKNLYRPGGRSDGDELLLGVPDDVVHIRQSSDRYPSFFE